MNIKTDTPQISLLKQAVERTIDFPLSTHGDFLRLSAGIEFTLREHMSESTLERLWGYSTRHYDTVYVRTLNVLPVLSVIIVGPTSAQLQNKQRQSLSYS